METSLARYEAHLETKGNRASSVATTITRLRAWMDREAMLDEINNQGLKERYAERQTQVAVATHRSELAEVKTFFRWAVKLKLVHRSPAENIEPVGRKRRGKPQLRKSEAKAFQAQALYKANQGDEGALAALTVALHGLRAGEIVRRRVRDVDVTEDGVLLWIAPEGDGKTEAATRYHEVPEPLASLLAAKAHGRDPSEYLFPANSSTGHHTVSWLRNVVRRLCEEAKIPVITTQGLRGTWATLTLGAGNLALQVASELGHTNPKVTRTHYAQAGAEDRKRVLRLVK